MNPNFFTPKNSAKFTCEKCDFNSCKESDYIRHTMTSKHIRRTNPNDLALKNADFKKYECKCGKEYKHLSSLCNHKKTCSDIILNDVDKEKDKEKEKDKDKEKDKEKEIEGEEKYNDDDCNNILILEILKQNQEFKELIIEKTTVDNKDSLIMELVKQNQEFKELMLEQNKYMMELAKNAGHNTINNTSNKFNLQVFLNETCKDAMNITDFVNSLVLDFEDLENMGHLGYVEGISRIFLRGVRGMDVSKRPFHCSDIKRETMFVKDMEGWEKENSDNEKMTTTIKRIACKNLRQATAWMAAHQKAIADTDSKPHSQYMKMMSQCLGGATAAEDKLNYNKIIRRVAQEVFIDKNKD